MLSTTPANLTASVPVSQINQVVLSFSENLDPCTVDETTILFHQYATGDPVYGFVPAADQTPGDPFSWGSGLPRPRPPRRVRCDVQLTQDMLQTTVTLRPIFGEFPDNALLVVQVTTGVRDFGGLPATPLTFSFTTENRPTQIGLHAVRVRRRRADQREPDERGGEHAARAEQGAGLRALRGRRRQRPDRATSCCPSAPDTARGPVGCIAPYAPPNDGIPDDFDPDFGHGPRHRARRCNTCFNGTDGSTAVVFEYRSFQIRPGVTVRITGRNPAIILVQGDVLIQTGGRLFARGDGNTVPQSNGANGAGYSQAAPPAFAGGRHRVAGGGNGGNAQTQNAGRLLRRERSPGLLHDGRHGGRERRDA